MGRIVDFGSLLLDLLLRSHSSWDCFFLFISLLGVNGDSVSPLTVNGLLLPSSFVLWMLKTLLLISLFY